MIWGYSRTNANREGFEDIVFFNKNTGTLKSVTLPLQILYKMKHYPWKSHKIKINSLELPRPKTKTLEFPNCTFSIPLKITCSQAPTHLLLISMNMQRRGFLSRWSVVKKHVLPEQKKLLVL